VPGSERQAVAARAPRLLPAPEGAEGQRFGSSAAGRGDGVRAG